MRNPVKYKKYKKSFLLRCDNNYHTEKGMTLTWQQALMQIINNVNLLSQLR